MIEVLIVLAVFIAAFFLGRSTAKGDVKGQVIDNVTEAKKATDVVTNLTAVARRNKLRDNIK